MDWVITTQLILFRILLLTSRFLNDSIVTPEPDNLATHYLQGFGFDRLCGLTGTVLGPGFFPIRTLRGLVTQTITIPPFPSYGWSVKATNRASA